MTPRERAVAAATTFNANNPGHFPGRPLIEGLVENAVKDALRAVQDTVPAVGGLVWNEIPDKHPPSHAPYVVLRNGRVFTATPCYGLHLPWWVVRTMPDSWPNEADPVAMQDGDRWVPLADFLRFLDVIPGKST